MQIKDVTKKYNGKPVVDAVNLEIPKGKVISFIGSTVRANLRLWELFRD